MTRCYVFDIDGTLADASHRLHHIQKEPKDWDAFFDACVDDKPIAHLIDLAQALADSGTDIVYVSGRSDRVRRATTDWLNEHCLPHGYLYMRKIGDHRPDDIVKSEILDRILAAGLQPIMAFDDRDRVVKMWRARGIPCAQVAEGDF